MVRTSLVVTIVVTLALAVATAAFARTDTMKLKGTVGPGFSIKLTQNGHAVKTLKAGTYTFVISDKASIHNFVVEQERGGKFEKALTGVSFSGTKTVKVKLRAGKWKYYCAPHEATMHGFFTVK
jgi:plastocyanin